MNGELLADLDRVLNYVIQRENESWVAAGGMSAPEDHICWAGFRLMQWLVEQSAETQEKTNPQLLN
jgi:hypothetical protein